MDDVGTNVIVPSIYFIRLRVAVCLRRRRFPQNSGLGCSGLTNSTAGGVRKLSRLHFMRKIQAASTFSRFALSCCRLFRSFVSFLGKNSPKFRLTLVIPGFRDDCVCVAANFAHRFWKHGVIPMLPILFVKMRTGHWSIIRFRGIFSEALHV